MLLPTRLALTIYPVLLSVYYSLNDYDRNQINEFSTLMRDTDVNLSKNAQEEAGY